MAVLNYVQDVHSASTSAAATTATAATLWEALVHEWNPSTVATTSIFVVGLLINNGIAWICAAHITLAHDRRLDGDTDGTDREGETTGSGASGTGISSYRQQQLVFVRAAIWSNGPPPPPTPIPLRIYLMVLGTIFSSLVAGIVFAMGFVQNRLPATRDDVESGSVGRRSNPSSFFSSHSWISLHWDDALLILSLSVLIGVGSTVIALQREITLYLRTLRHLRLGTTPFVHSPVTNISNMSLWFEIFSATFATGFLGWSIGWHFASQLMVSAGVALQYKMISLLYDAYNTASEESIAVVVNATANATASIASASLSIGAFLRGSGVLELLTLSIVALLFVYLLGKMLVIPQMSWCMLLNLFPCFCTHLIKYIEFTLLSSFV